MFHIQLCSAHYVSNKEQYERLCNQSSHYADFLCQGSFKYYLQITLLLGSNFYPLIVLLEYLQQLQWLVGSEQQLLALC